MSGSQVRYCLAVPLPNVKAKGSYERSNGPHHGIIVTPKANQEGGYALHQLRQVILPASHLAMSGRASLRLKHGLELQY
jgi:hypothetical protein